MVDVALSLGSNSGDRREYLRKMEEMVCGLLLAPVRRSAIMETEPVDVDDLQPWYLNRIIGGSYGGDAFMLLDSCKNIERVLGRTEKGLRRQRTADVDILLFGNEVIATSELTLPHPAIRSRRFCIEGLNRIAPDAVIGDPPAKISEWYRIVQPHVRAQKLRFVTSEGGCSDY